jgi:hypothetical protein
MAKARLTSQWQNRKPQVVPSQCVTEFGNLQVVRSQIRCQILIFSGHPMANWTSNMRHEPRRKRFGEEMAAVFDVGVKFARAVLRRGPVITVDAGRGGPLSAHAIDVAIDQLDQPMPRLVSRRADKSIPNQLPRLTWHVGGTSLPARPRTAAWSDRRPAPGCVGLK